MEKNEPLLILVNKNGAVRLHTAYFFLWRWIRRSGRMANTQWGRCGRAVDTNAFLILTMSMPLRGKGSGNGQGKIEFAVDTIGNCTQWTTKIRQ
jgi:hypothetical protein